MVSIISIKSKKLKGEIFVPGDKSISHRALILGACAVGKTTIENLLESEDVLSTLSCLLYTSPSPRDRTRSRMPSSA